jgi:dihydroorotate dehydrogenase
LYRLIRPLLFALDAETSHGLSFRLLHLFYLVPGVRILVRRCFKQRTPALPVTVMNLRFSNPIGLAAGLDKNAEHLAPLSDFGFGGLELGTVTPRPQPGNPRPRLFRLPHQAALINRMGFNNVGVETFLKNLQRQDRPCPIGINIGKNKDTPLEHALEDYLTALRAVYAHADYVTVNISSPNTAGLRDLQGEENLDALLCALKSEQAALTKIRGRYVPIALKIAPDLNDDQIAAIARLVREHRFDAVIATNTTITRPGLEHEPRAAEVGGLSGRPLKPLATAVIRKLYRHLQGQVPIIGVGGIENPDDAWDKLVAGADLIQIYSALIYQGPAVVRDIVTGLAARVQQSGAPTLAAALAQARRRH